MTAMTRRKTTTGDNGDIDEMATIAITTRRRLDEYDGNDDDGDHQVTTTIA